MSVTILEYIAQNIETSINAVTTGNGFNYTLTAVRTKRNDFDSAAPSDLKVLISQAESKEPDSVAIMCNEYLQTFAIKAMVYDSNSETSAMDIKRSKVAGDIIKKLLTDVTRGGYAIETSIESASDFDDGNGVAGVLINCVVHYRTAFGDPFTRL